MTTTAHTAPTAAITAEALAIGETIVSGHGYGEAPATVVATARFTARTFIVTLTDGATGRRTITVAPTTVFDVEVIDYDTARDER